MEHYASRDELNGLGQRLGALEVQHTETKTIAKYNSEAIEKLVAYTNSLLLKVVFIVCAPILVMILINIFKDR